MGASDDKKTVDQASSSQAWQEWTLIPDFPLPPSSTRTIGITGVAGTMGQKLRPALEAAGYKVIGFDLADPISGNPVNTSLIDFPINICDKNTLKGKFEGCDVLIHLAGMFSHLMETY